MRLYDHFARPLPVEGKTPTRGNQTCRGCGEPIYRAGTLLMSDGVRGNWRHHDLTPAQDSTKVKA